MDPEDVKDQVPSPSKPTSDDEETIVGQKKKRCFVISSSSSSCSDDEGSSDSSSCSSSSNSSSCSSSSDSPTSDSTNSDNEELPPAYNLRSNVRVKEPGDKHFRLQKSLQLLYSGWNFETTYFGPDFMDLGSNRKCLKALQAGLAEKDISVMDLNLIKMKLHDGLYKSKKDLVGDVKRMLRDVRTYVPKGSDLLRKANDMEKFMMQKYRRYRFIFPDEGISESCDNDDDNVEHGHVVSSKAEPNVKLTEKTSHDDGISSNQEERLVNDGEVPGPSSQITNLSSEANKASNESQSGEVPSSLNSWSVGKEGTNQPVDNGNGSQSETSQSSTESIKKSNSRKRKVKVELISDEEDSSSTVQEMPVNQSRDEERKKFLLQLDLNVALQDEGNKVCIMETIRKTEPDFNEADLDLYTLKPITLTNLECCVAFCMKKKLPPLRQIRNPKQRTWIWITSF